MAKQLALVDRKLLDLAANGYSPDEMAAETYLPAEQAIARVKELLASHDVWDELETRRLSVHSLQRLKSQVEQASVDVTNPKMIEAYTKLVLATERLQSKTTAISDSELERLAVLQASRIVQLFEMAYGRARQLLSEEYPEIDLGRVDDVMLEGLRQFAPEIEAK